MAYTLDLRTHPAKYLLAQGVPISLNSDDPGFYGYEGVTLDYVYAFLAWDLDLRDLKQLALNAIKYSSVEEETKAKHNEIF